VSAIPPEDDGFDVLRDGDMGKHEDAVKITQVETIDRWFLSTSERGNPDTMMDRHHSGGQSYTRGNHVSVLLDGAAYFRALYEALCSLAPGDEVIFTDWRGDGDERLAGPGTEISTVLSSSARRGVNVRGLVWRSHVDRMHFSEKENRRLAEAVNEAGGEVLLDERVRRAGSHHQKIVVLRRTNGVLVAFAGGIDLSHGRHDDQHHGGDAQVVQLDARYGPRPAWHDVQLRIDGPATADIEQTFHERWNDRTPLDHRAPWRVLMRWMTQEPRQPSPLPYRATSQQAAGSHAVQVLRTYPAKRPAYPFARRGERSVARAYLKAFAQARALVYIEDQYLWSSEAAGAVATALRRTPELRVVAVVPKYPDRDDKFAGPPYRMAQERAIAEVMAAGGERVAVYDLESESGWPIYVHAKVCVIDDVWLAVGSDNINRRSWTNDSELSCAIVDEDLDEREPCDPGGRGDHARVLARDTRLRLWGEHTAIDPSSFVDPKAGFDALTASANALDAWHASGCRGARPPGRLRRHRPEPVRPVAKVWAAVVYRVLIDPDGRPAAMRWRRRF
jgi:phosphatidylserine/phosphatidylglycerophosphate/cardiolipin synthase-like enzyme